MRSTSEVIWEITFEICEFLENNSFFKPMAGHISPTFQTFYVDEVIRERMHVSGSNGTDVDQYLQQLSITLKVHES